MTSAKTIQIYLPSGNPKGLRIAEVTNRTYQITAIPRSELAASKPRAELKQAGIYILLGSVGQLDLAPIYIGAAERCLERISQHNKIDYWNIALAITSRTNSFTKAHAHYLEWHCLNQAIAAKRYTVQNKAAPREPHLPEALHAEMQECFEIIAILASALGYPVFEKLELSDRREEIFCKTRDAVAKGRYSEDGLIVYEGSKIWVKDAPTLGKKDIATRQLHIKRGDLKLQNGVYVLQRTLVFPTPSEASNFVLGRKSNGWTHWKYENGDSLDDTLRKA